MAERLPRWMRVGGHVFGWVAVSAAAAHLALTDWGWYADIDGRQELMFETPWPQRLVVSGILGLISGIAVVGAWFSVGFLQWCCVGKLDPTEEPGERSVYSTRSELPELRTEDI